MAQLRQAAQQAQQQVAENNAEWKKQVALLLDDLEAKEMALQQRTEEIQSAQAEVAALKAHVAESATELSVFKSNMGHSEEVVQQKLLAAKAVEESKNEALQRMAEEADDMMKHAAHYAKQAERNQAGQLTGILAAAKTQAVQQSFETQVAQLEAKLHETTSLLHKAESGQKASTEKLAATTKTLEVQTLDLLDAQQDLDEARAVAADFSRLQQDAQIKQDEALAEAEEKIEDFVIEVKEKELKYLFLEEQMRSGGTTPYARMPEAFLPDNTLELEALRKQLKRATAAMQAMDIQRCDLQLQLDELRATRRPPVPAGAQYSQELFEHLEQDLEVKEKEVRDYEERLNQEMASRKRALQTAEANSIELDAAKLRIQELIVENGLLKSDCDELEVELHSAEETLIRDRRQQLLGASSMTQSPSLRRGYRP
jgi:chromosome segregation ATPase